MNTVEALNVLGKALCGDSFEVKPGLTDAETILEIAKNYTGGGSGGSGESDGGGGRALYVNRIMEAEGGPGQDPATWDWASAYFVGEGLSAEDIALMTPCYEWEEDGAHVVDTYGGDSDLAGIGAFRGILANEGAIEGFISFNIYGDVGNSGSVIMALYNSATGTIFKLPDGGETS